jgi:hypothetical protein
MEAPANRRGFFFSGPPLNALSGVGLVVVVKLSALVSRCHSRQSPVDPHPWPPAIRELDSSVLEGELHFRNRFSRHHELGALEMNHGRVAEARSLGKVYLPPAQ